MIEIVDPGYDPETVDEKNGGLPQLDIVDVIDTLLGPEDGSPVPEFINLEDDAVADDDEVSFTTRPFHQIDPHDTPGLQVVSKKYTTEKWQELYSQGETTGWVSRVEDGQVYWQREELVRSKPKKDEPEETLVHE